MTWVPHYMWWSNHLSPDLFNKLSGGKVNKTKLLQVRIDQNTDKKLSGIARRLGVNKSQAIREMISNQSWKLYDPLIIGGDEETNDE